MPNSPQPQGTHREGLGARPFQSYKITRDPEGQLLGVTQRQLREKGADQWSTDQTGDLRFDSHKLAVEALVARGPVPSPEDLPDALRVDASDLAEHVALTATSPDGKCARANSKVRPCGSKAGAGTSHLGTGACQKHEGHPILEAAAV